MRGRGAWNEIESVPDEVLTILADTTGQKFDYPTGAQVMRVSGVSTAYSLAPFYVNISSSGVAIPTTGLTTSTTAASQPVLGFRNFQIPSGSTCLSVISPSTVKVIAEFWKKGG